MDGSPETSYSSTVLTYSATLSPATSPHTEGARDIAAHIAAANAGRINARHIRRCVEADIDAALRKRVVVCPEFDHTLVQINAALVKIIGDRVDTLTLKLFVLVCMIFFRVTCAIHKGRTSAVIETLGENTRVDVHQRIAAFAVRHLAEWTDRIAVDIGNNAEPGRLAAAGKTLYASVTIWYVDVYELRAGTISDRCATGQQLGSCGC